MDENKSTEEKNSLEQQGHLSRTQLYFIVGVLSLVVLGLSGYVTWDYIQTNDTNTQTTATTTENEAESAETEIQEESVPELELKTLNGRITDKRVHEDKYLIDFIDFDDCERVGGIAPGFDCSSAETATYEIAEESLILLTVCDGVSDEWHIYYSRDDFVGISNDYLDTCFGEGANGYQVSIINDTLAVFLKNGVSVP